MGLLGKRSLNKILNFKKCVIFKESALRRFFHRVAISVLLSVCLSVPFSCNIFLGLSSALRSHEQFKASDWSTLLVVKKKLPKGPWRRRWRRRRGGIKKMLKSFLAAVLLSALVERFFVSRPYAGFFFIF